MCLSPSRLRWYLLETQILDSKENLLEGLQRRHKYITSSSAFDLISRLHTDWSTHWSWPSRVQNIGDVIRWATSLFKCVLMFFISHLNVLRIIPCTFGAMITHWKLLTLEFNDKRSISYYVLHQAVPRCTTGSTTWRPMHIFCRSRPLLIAYTLSQGWDASKNFLKVRVGRSVRRNRLATSPKKKNVWKKKGSNRAEIYQILNMLNLYFFSVFYDHVVRMFGLLTIFWIFVREKIAALSCYQQR